MTKPSLIRSAQHRANISAGLRALPYKAKTAAERTRGLRMRRQGVMLWYKMTHPCEDCGCNDPRVLDFDHVRGEKSFNLKEAKTRPMAVILAEIKKCAVVCANCHRIRTQDRIDAGDYGNTYYSDLGLGVL
ncbi:hypothetical protein LCGC14_1646200 [marine sediment metagenome]|uniref:HNH domain-containing protein n=1 Tax=marine sediment metagenome TaxID=412755 RepID=A0A0F9KE00_9ZZZZ